MKKCTQCKLKKLTAEFSTRKGRFKLDGTPMYTSTCKGCRRENAAEKRIKDETDRLMKKKIDPRFLVRGNVSIGNRDCAISSQA